MKINLSINNNLYLILYNNYSKTFYKEIFFKIYKEKNISFLIYKENLYDDIDVLKYIIDYLIKEDKKYIDLLIYTKNELFYKLNTFAILNPIYFWSQNNSFWHLKVKLFNKIDYPLALNIDLKYILIRPDKLILKIFSLNEKIIFIWELNYFQPVLPKFSSYIYYKNNEIEFKIKKSFNILWRNAHYESKIIHKNQFEWVEMNELFVEDFIEEYNIIKKSKSNIEKEENKKEKEIEMNISIKNNLKKKKNYFKKFLQKYQKLIINKDEYCYINDLDNYLIFIMV